MTINTNPLSYNDWVTQVATLAVVNTTNVGGVNQFVDAPLQAAVPLMLDYAENRLQRDLDMLPSQTSNQYAATAGSNILPIPIDDFVTILTAQVATLNGMQVVNTCSLTPTSREFIQNCYGGLAGAGTPRFFAMVGDNFGDGADSYNNMLLGPTPNYPYTIIVNGTIRTPSLFKYASVGVADTAYTYISAYYPEMLVLASLIYITMYQRNFGNASDDPQMGMTYEKQYQLLRPGAVMEENRKKQLGSAYTAYSTPVAATPTR